MIAALDSEKELLGSCLVGRLDWREVQAALGPDDWADGGNRSIAQLMTRMADTAQAWDGVTCMQAADNVTRPMIGELMAGATLMAKSAEAHIAAIRSASRRRKLVAECERLSRLAQGNDDAEAVISDAQAAMLGLLDDTTRDSVVSVTDAAQSWLEELERRMDHKGDVLGVPTGLPDLDRLTGGFEPGQLIVIAGRPSHGKTTLAMNFAEHAMLKQSSRVLVFSLEMSQQELVGRMAASISRVDMGKFRRPSKLDNADWSRLSGALASVHGKPLWVDDSSALHVNQIRARARMHAQRHGVDMVIVDYLGLCRADSPKPYEAVTQISGALKALAKELHVPVIVVAQLNREVDKRKTPRPVMSDLRDSGAVEQDADKILFVWRPEVYEPENPSVKGQAEVILAKNRNGQTGIVDLTFRGEFNQFREVTSAYGDAA